MANRRRLALGGALLVTAGAAAAGVWSAHDTTPSPEPAGAASATGPDQSPTTEEASAPSTSAPDVYGAPATPVADDPIDIATDAPATATAPAHDELSNLPHVLRLERHERRRRS